MEPNEGLRVLRRALRHSPPDVHAWIGRTASRIAQHLRPLYGARARPVCEALARIECLRAHAVHAGDADGAAAYAAGIDELLNELAPGPRAAIMKLLKVEAVA